MDREIDMLCRPLRGRSRWIAGVALHAALLSACTFSPEGGLQPGPDTGPQPPDDGRTVDMGVPTDTPPPVDAPPGPPPENVIHVPAAGWSGGTSDATWTGDVTIDTTALTISGPGTEGLTLRAQVQDPPSGPELALLHVGALTVNDVNVRVTGSRPLVIISSENIVLNGRIDAGAREQTPGAGGAGPGAGAGVGQSGVHSDTANDSGGGGGGHATAGARGGHGCQDDFNGGDSCNDPRSADGASGGPAYGEEALPVLTGGSGGGRGGFGGDDPCTPGDGGAGGGAVQLYAVESITIGAGGGISVGGGGGGGGVSDECGAAAGGGGGSGGAVYLQAERIQHDGLLAANGGAGAGSGQDGTSGANGTLNETPAPGAPDPGDAGGSGGGAGAAGGNGPQQGQEQTDEPNGGGGGGAAGRILLNCSDLNVTGRFSPAGFGTASCQR